MKDLSKATVQPAPRKNRLPKPISVGVTAALAVGGIALGVVGRFVNGLVARSRARGARRRLRESIAKVVDDLVLAPMDRELAAYRTVTDSLRTARR